MPTNDVEIPKTQIRKDIYCSVDCSSKNKKDTARKQKEEGIFDTLINTSSRRVKRGGKCSNDVDWLQIGLRYGLAKLDNRQLSQNVQDIRWSH